MNAELRDLTADLISKASVSPDDLGCQESMAEFLAGIGFSIEHMPFSDVSNLWATHGSGAPYFVFAGHTDVVPSGPEEQWQTPPFIPTEIDGHLHGRGAADMKGSLAAMMLATRDYFAEGGDQHKGTIAFLITSDEEADAFNGTKKVMTALTERGLSLDWCLIGEPSSSQSLGDVVRTGRRGSLHGNLTIHGTQGHVAYPDKASNPIHNFAAALMELTHETWDDGNEFFPPTSMQISNIHAGTGVTNVIPGDLEVVFNFRYSTQSSQQSLSSRVEAILQRHELKFTLDWQLSGEPFLTVGGELIPAVQTAIREHTGLDTELSTSGGTSDGRFIAPTGTQVVELGPLNSTIHKIDECVSLADLSTLQDIYKSVLNELTR